MHIIKNTIYSFLNILTFGLGIKRKINGFIIYFPPKWSRYFEPNYEKENILFLISHCYEGMVVMDIGAHLGLITNIAGQLVKESGRVYAFEPTPTTFKILKKIVRLNKLTANVICINHAISDFDGEIDFFIDEIEGSNSNSLIQRPDKNKTPLKIKTSTLDSFIEINQITKLDLIKIDAEGAEYIVLQGAKQSILKFKPKIILALHPKLILTNLNTLEDIFKLIVELKYSVYYNNRKLEINAFVEMKELFDVHLIPN